MPLAPGTRLGPYEVSAALGAGGMGEVYRARDTRLGREVAIKVLPRHLSDHPDLRTRFEREAQTISSLNHPHICVLFDIGHEDGIDYLVMELVEGETLAERVARGPLPPRDVLALGIQIADALERAHRAGVIHRDLKPGNVMLAHSGAKLMDFGLARAGAWTTSAPAASVPALAALTQSPTVVAPLTAEGALVGTIQYMAPEQVEGKEADARSDVWSLGCVLHELATGAPAFAGKDPVSILAGILRDTVPHTDAIVSDFPARLAAVIHRCLEKPPEKRPASAAEVHEALLAIQRWAHTDGPNELARVVDRIQGLEEGPEAWQAFQLAREIAQLEPGHPQLERLQTFFARAIAFTSDPPGATVSVKYYGAPDSAWLRMGTTPLTSVPWPKGFTRVRLEHDGLRPVEDVLWNVEFVGSAFDYKMAAPGTWPDDMEWVPSGTFPLFMPGIDHLEEEPMAGFLMDRDPVTNRAFKRFVDSGGYRTAALWPETIGTTPRTLGRAELMRQLVDATGQPGPAGWEGGAYAAGEDDLPVTGVSWYEAAAYAAWADQSLPTLFHWNRVALTCASAQIIAQSNLAGRALAPVGSTHSMNRFGVRDLAGNVREWVFNATGDGKRFLLGGGWNDPEYAFNDAWAQPELDRSATNGFRCIRHVEPEPNRERLARVIELPTRDFRSETPVPDSMFQFFVRQFAYDRAPLAEKLESEESTLLGRMQTVTIAAAYGGEQLTLYVFLPARPGPHQPIVVFPGSNAIHTRVFNPLDLRRADFLVRSGRAVVLPVYKGTYHRGGDLHSDYPSETASYRDYVIMWVRDLGRTIDYLESRADMDATKIGYYGLSWGGYMGAILPAIERRIRANVLYVAGLTFQRALPEVDAIHYITRVTQPTLMLNGELDFFFPVETSQKPMFDLLGTPPEDKRRLTYPGGHSVPRVETIKHTLEWFDRYLGPVAG